VVVATCRVIAVTALSVAALAIGWSVASTRAVSYGALPSLTLFLIFPAALAVQALGVTVVAATRGLIASLLAGSLMVVVLVCEYLVVLLSLGFAGALDGDAGYHPAAAGAMALPLCALALNAYLMVRVGRWYGGARPATCFAGRPPEPATRRADAHWLDTRVVSGSTS